MRLDCMPKVAAAQRLITAPESESEPGRSPRCTLAVMPIISAMRLLEYLSIAFSKADSGSL